VNKPAVVQLPPVLTSYEPLPAKVHPSVSVRAAVLALLKPPYIVATVPLLKIGLLVTAEASILAMRTEFRLTVCDPLLIEFPSNTAVSEHIGTLAPAPPPVPPDVVAHSARVV